MRYINESYMPRKVMVAPVGFEIDRILEAQKFEPCNIWYILRNPPLGADPVGQLSLHFADKVVAAVKSMHLQEFHVINVRQSDLLGLIRAYASAVREQLTRDPETEFIFNTSGSTKLAQFAGSFVASFCRVPVRIIYMQPEAEVVLASLITATPDQLHTSRETYLTHGECSPPFSLQYLPVIPYTQLTPAEHAILRDLAIMRERKSLSQFLPAITNNERTLRPKDIVKVGWSVKALEKLRLVRVHKVGSMKSVTITPEGDLVAAALEMFDVVS